MFAGVPARDVEDWTWGELNRQVEGCRRRIQTRAAIAYRETILTGAMFSGDRKPLPAIYEMFPFWTEDEIREMKLSKYKALMRRIAAKGGGGK